MAGLDFVSTHFKASLLLISPAEWCQVFLVTTTCAFLGVAVLPESIRQFLMNYGARAPLPVGGKDGGRSRADDEGLLVRLLATITSSTQVPHSWFWLFYCASVSLSVFWLVQCIMGGHVFEAVAFTQAKMSAGSGQGMSKEQGALTWALMALQGLRRLFEQIYVVKASDSTMWIVHWILGVAFYSVMSVAVWVDGSEALLNAQEEIDNNGGWLFKAAVGVLVFGFASVYQFRCHKTLAGLKQYSVPNNGMFRYLVCPHYTCECLLYISLAIIGAPSGAFFNRTLLCAVAFVIANLGITARGTRAWYITKFGEDSIARKWTMIPLIF